MGKLTTHVLDTARGKPAEGLDVQLFRLEANGWELIAEGTTNTDGRLPAPLVEGADFGPGEYELLFHVGPYLERAGFDLPQPKFLDVVPIRFGVAEDAHYHVPLLVSPYGYSTYRGS